MADPVWVVDTSSIIEIRRSVPNADRRAVFRRLSALVSEGRLKFPKQVVDELRRAANPDVTDPVLQWAEENELDACSTSLAYDKVKEVLNHVSEILDPAKDSGADEADPYVLALAVVLREANLDARVVTQETKDGPRKMSLNTASGLLGIPSVPLSGLLRAEWRSGGA
jgi:hypothetical protein